MIGRARADVPAAPGSAAAWKQFHGKLVFSDILIAQPAQFQSGDQMVEALNRQIAVSADRFVASAMAGKAAAPCVCPLWSHLTLC